MQRCLVTGEMRGQDFVAGLSDFLLEAVDTILVTPGPCHRLLMRVSKLGSYLIAQNTDSTGASLLLLNTTYFYNFSPLELVIDKGDQHNELAILSISSFYELFRCFVRR